MSSLISTDRCDGCSAQAYVSVTNGTTEFLFCGHHYNKHAKVLEEQGYSIDVDEREILTRRPVGAEVS